MYLNTLKAVDAIKHTEFYQKRNKEHRKLVMDKCNFILHSIIEGNKHNWELSSFQPVELNAKVLNRQLGNSYKDFISLLKACDVIKTNGSYVRLKDSSPDKAHCIRYGLTDKAKQSQRIKVGVLCKRTEKKLLAFKENHLNRMLADKTVASKIIRSITDVYVREDALAYLAQQQIETNVANANKRDKEIDVELMQDHYRASIDTIKKMNKAERLDEFTNVAGFYISSSKKVGRIFHTYATMPKCFLGEMVHRTGEHLYEIDFKNAQPILIGSNWIKETHSSAFGLATDALIKEAIPTQPLRSDDDSYSLKELDSNCFTTGEHIYNDNTIKRERERRRREREEGGICSPLAEPISDKERETTTERQRLQRMLFNGTFYKEIAEYCKLVAPEYYHLFQDDYPEFKRIVLGMGLYNKRVPLDKAHLMERILSEMFPSFMDYIRTTKRKKGYRAVSIDAQKAESALFIYGLFPLLSNDDFAIPRHDSVIVKESDVERIHQMLAELFLKQHPHLNLSAEEARNLFRITKLTNQ